MAWAYVQSTSGSFGSNSSVVGKQFSSNVVAGNTLIASATWGASGAGSTYTDSLGNVFVVRKEINDATNVQSASIADSVNILGGASSIVGHFTSGTPLLAIAILEYSGISAFDVAAGNVAAGSTAANNVNSTLVTTTVNNDLLLGVMFDIDGTSNTVSVGTGYTLRLNTDFGAGLLNAEDQSQAAAGSTQARWTQKQPHRYIGFMDALKPTVAGGAVSQFRDGFALMGGV